MALGYSTARMCHYALGHLPSDGCVAGLSMFTAQAVGTPGPVDIPGFLEKYLLTGSQ